MKPWSGLAAMMLLASMALFIASIASSHWIDNYSAGRQLSMGPFEACARDTPSGVDECRRVDDSCSASFTAPVADFVSGVNCHKVRATRALLIMALVFAGMAFVLTWLGYNSWDDIAYRIPAILLSLLSMACGLVGWALMVDESRRHFGSDWTYGWATGIGLGAWLLPLAATLACMVPSPARDLRTGEVLAKDAMRRRGPWYEIFTWNFWARGEDWGGRSAAERQLGAGGPPAGTGYRESASGWGKGATSAEMERERERELERERYARERGETYRYHERPEERRTHTTHTTHTTHASSHPYGKDESALSERERLERRALESREAYERPAVSYGSSGPSYPLGAPERTAERPTVV